MPDTIDFNVWEALTTEVGLSAVLEEHPEVKILWERREKLDGPISINGVNPILHILTEAIVESQIQQDDPPAVKETFARLQEQGLSLHAARGSIAAVLLPHIFDVLKEKEVFDNDVYIRQLKLLGRDLGKVGRNERCPCGSGKKYKKCCLPIAGDLKVSAGAGKLILGANYYSFLEHLKTLPPDSSLIQLENRSHIAEFLEEKGDIEGALACLQENVVLAERAHQNLLVNALQDLQLLCLNHTELLSTVGLEINKRLISLASDKDKGNYLCDEADLLSAAGDLEEAERKYLAIFEDLPDYDFARYRYALFLDKHGRSKEAEEVLRALLEHEDEIADETYFSADDLLEEISRRKNM